jgi:hypothetical protein
MQTDGFSEAAKKDPPLSKLIRDPIDPRIDASESASAQSTSQRSSPHGEEFNQASASSLGSQATTRSSLAALSSHYGIPQTRPQHISGEPNTNIRVSNNPTAHPKLPQIYSPQLRSSASGPLSPPSMGKAKALNSIYTPLRLDSQLLSSPWPGNYQLPTPQLVPSPTRTVYSSYWNAASSPVPYPCGSPTTYSSGVRIVSPSAQSLRQQQQQHQHSNDGSSPVQLSISTLGRENSFTAAGTSGFASPNLTGMVHSAILDAPLQISLAPPPCGDDYPFFSFGNSILLSTPFTPTIQTPNSRGHSIYHDAVVELSQHRHELDNPLSAFHAGSVRQAGHDGTPLRLGGGAISSSSITPLTADVAEQLHQPSPRTTSEASFASGSGVSVLPKIADRSLMDWTKLRQTSPPSPRLPEPLTARPNACSDGDESKASAKHAATAEEVCGEADDSHSNSRNSTPVAMPSNVDDTSNSPNPVLGDEDAVARKQQQQLGGVDLNRTKRPHETNDHDVTGPGEVSDEETNSAARVSLAEANLAYSEDHTKTSTAPAAGSTPPEREGDGSALLIATPQTTFSHHQSTQQPNTPSVVLPAANVSFGVTDFHPFMPSPMDESSHGFAALRDGVTLHSPTEHSTSALSSVPNLGVWQASPVLFPMWHSLNVSPSTGPSLLTTLTDLLEVLRLLQSDVANVYNRVSVNEHTVRHWASGTLSALLHLVVDASHSAKLAAAEEVETAATAESQQEGLNYAQLCAQLQSGAASCVEELRNTLPFMQRDRDVLEPLLLTSMLARRAITALLRSLEKSYLRTESQSTTMTTTTAAAAAQHPGSHDRAVTKTSTATNNTSVPATRRISSVAPVAAPLTAERVDVLMDSNVLAKELGGEWHQFASDYNHQLLRYLFLRVVYGQLNRDDGISVGCGNSRAASAAGGSATSSQRDIAVPSAHGAGSSGNDKSSNSSTTTLRAIEAAWAEDQLKRWSVIFSPNTVKTADRKDARKGDPAREVDEAGTQLFREAACQEFPTYDVVAETFSSFREGECWRCWYTLLGQMMECTFNAQEKKELFEYVEKQFLHSPSPSASAALHAIGVGEITLEQVEEALDRAEAALTTLEEQGKTRRLTILQLLLHRIFVLGVVSSVQRALGKDAIVSDAQLATFAQVQRKSLEDVETQLIAEHAERQAHIKCIHAFVSLFSKPTSSSASATHPAGLHGASETHLLRGTATPSTPSPDPLWNISSVGSLAFLLTGTPSHSSATERSHNTVDNSRSEEEEAHKRARDALALAREVCTRAMEATRNLCVLLQSDVDVDVTESKHNYSVAPTKVQVPSTRALRRLQASLIETHRSVTLCLASLHVD